MGPHVKLALQAPVQDVMILGTSMAVGIVQVSLIPTYTYVIHVNLYCCKYNNLLIALCPVELQDVMTVPIV